jgi:hypothetical protein
MTNENKEKLAKFLKEQGTNTMVLFYDQVDDRRIDLSVWYEESENDVYIAGDEGEMYEFSELELIDERVLNF